MKHLVFIFAASLLAVAGQAAAQYRLIDNFEGKNFFDGFTFFDQHDPTNGNVRFVNADQANQSALAGYFHDKIYLGVDRQTNPSSDPKNQVDYRYSTRVISNNKYNKGLIIADFEHMPFGCSVWPAFWTLGSGAIWPGRGEIDILEGVNSNHLNHVTLHTSPDCVLTNRGLGGARSRVEETDCAKEEGHVGCGQKVLDPKAYGPGFNANGGGVYAMEWTSETIKTWFFPRESEFTGILSNSTVIPDIASFGPPITVHGGSGCDIDQHFVDHQIIFDTTLCGEWAGRQEVWAMDKTCRKKSRTCQEFVTTAYAEEWDQAYWLINYVRVFQPNGTYGVPV